MSIEDQFKPVYFESPKEARSHIYHILKCQSFYGYDFEIGSTFQVLEKIDDENEIKIGRKIKVK